MTFTSDTLFNNVTDTLKNLNFFQNGTNFIVILSIVVICAIMISPRKISNVKLLLLPLCVGFTIIGLKVPMLFMVLAGILFIMETLTTKIIGDVLEVAKQTVSSGIETGIKGYKYVSGGTERTMKRYESQIKTQEREKKIKTAEEKGIIPFRKGTSISDVLERTAKQRDNEIIYNRDILKAKSERKREKIINDWVNFDPDKSSGQGKGEWARKMSEFYNSLRSQGYSKDDARKKVGDTFKGKFKVRKDNMEVNE